MSWGAAGPGAKGPKVHPHYSQTVEFFLLEEEGLLRVREGVPTRREGGLPRVGRGVPHA